MEAKQGRAKLVHGEDDRIDGLVYPVSDCTQRRIATRQEVQTREVVHGGFPLNW